MSTVAERMQMSKHRWVFLLQGTIAILVGVLFINEPGETIRTGIILLGTYWLFTSVLAFTRIFFDRSNLWILSIFIVTFGALAVGFALRDPVLTTSNVPTFLIIILGVQGLFIGVLDIINAFQGGGRGWFVLGGTNLLIGLLLVCTPLAGLAISRIGFGVFLLVQGAAFVAWAFRVTRRVDPQAC